MATEAVNTVDWRSSDRKHSELRLRVRPPAARRVLVVDDDPLIRTCVARALRASGYDVIQADSAERAMHLLAEEGESLSLLLSDVDLPGLSGAELVEHAQGAFPSLPTQLMSGRSKDWLVSQRVLERDVDLLQKPFKVADLLDRVDQLLASDHEGADADSRSGAAQH